MKKIMTNFILQKTAEGLAESTIESYCYCLRDFLVWLEKNKIEKVEENDIVDYFIFLRGKKYSNATLCDKYAILHIFFNYCVKMNIYEKNPMTMKKPSRDKIHARSFTDAEVETIMRYFNERNSFCKLRDYAIILILYSTGIRKSELLQIVSLNEDFITVIGKGRKERSIPIYSGLRRELKQYIVEREKIACCPYFIVTRDGKKMTKNGLRAVFDRLSAKTGISGKRFSPHTWRHTYAKNFLRFGGSLISLQKLLGHNDLKTTEIYLDWDKNAISEENEKFNPLNIFLKRKFF